MWISHILDQGKKTPRMNLGVCVEMSDLIVPIDDVYLWLAMNERNGFYHKWNPMKRIECIPIHFGDLFDRLSKWHQMWCAAKRREWIAVTRIGRETMPKWSFEFKLVQMTIACVAPWWFPQHRHFRSRTPLINVTHSSDSRSKIRFIRFILPGTDAIVETFISIFDCFKYPLRLISIFLTPYRSRQNISDPSSAGWL